MKFMVCALGEPEEHVYIPQVRELGVGIELQSYGLKGCQSPAVWEERLQKHLAFRKKYHGELVVHGPFLGIEYAYTDHLLREAVRRRMDMTFEVVKTLHTDRVVLHTGFKLEVLQFDYKAFWIEETVRFWKAEIQRYAALDIQVVLENIIEPDPLMMIDVHDRVDSPYFKLCLDIGHTNIWSKQPPALWIERMGDRLAHVHMHDNMGRFDQHLPPGHGNIDFNAVFDALYATAPGVTVSLEVDSDSETIMTALKKLIRDYRL